MMYDFWLLFLAHLLGDYAFQTNGIAKNKTKNLKGLLNHIYLIFVANVIVLMPHTLESWTGILTITFIHFLEDSQPFSKKKGNVWVFLLDQTVHIVTIAVVSYYINFSNPVLPPRTAYVISAFLFVIYFLDFVEFFILKGGPYNRDIIKVSYGALILTFAFYWLWAIPIVIAAAFFGRKNRIKENWIYITLVTVISFLIVYTYKRIF